MIRKQWLARVLSVALIVPMVSACSESGGKREHIGYVEAEWVYVAAPRSGWIVSRPASEGQKVTKGSLLFTLDDQSQQAATEEAGSRVAQAQAQARDIATGAREPEISALQAELEEARASLRLATVRRERIRTLAADGFASRQQRDEADAGYRTAQARVKRADEQIRVARQAGRPASRAAAQASVEAARANKSSAEYELDQRAIRASVAGEVSETFLNPGEFANAGSPVLALLPDDGLRVHLFVTQEERPAYRLGTTLQVRADGLNKPVEGKVSFVATEAEFTPPVIYSRDAREKLVFLVKVDMPANAGLRPGLPVDVYGP